LERGAIGDAGFGGAATRHPQRTEHPIFDLDAGETIAEGNPHHGLSPTHPLVYSRVDDSKFKLVVAGNETTRNATSGGLMALVDNPEQFRRLKSDPSLAKLAVEEIARWTSPAIQFARTATADTQVRGQKIRAGESVCLFYPSANRDEEVFEQPFKFDIGRDPNPHLAFGIGEHFCLGSNLAKLELEVIFRQLAKRLEYAELAGPVARLRSSFVGGIKHLPIRYKLNPEKGSPTNR